MLCLSQTTGYAIQALSILDRAGARRTLARHIAHRTGIPQAYLSKLLHALGRSGLISTKRGYRGGFVLARPAPEITLMDIVEAVEGHRWHPRCLLGQAECSDERNCPTHEFWQVERGRIESKLRQLSLRDVSTFETAQQAKRRASTRRPTRQSGPRARGARRRE